MSTQFWQENQVGGPYFTVEESEAALIYREHLYPDLHDLMPVRFPGHTILDYGCGPGHDTLLFLLHGAYHVYFADISWLALQITSDRLGLHHLRDQATGLLADDGDLPEVDHVHCAGVLHHVVDPIGALKRMRGALKPKGEARVMVYDGELSPHSQSEVPITEWWTHDEFIAIAKEGGFEAEWLGSYPCPAEWRPDCYAACYRLT
jgi:SAM-dependent methyltransferase